MTITQIINANPKACYRTLEQLILENYPEYTPGDVRYTPELAAARPECGYRCDGDDGPHPDNGSPGCFYSGKCEC